MKVAVIGAGTMGKVHLNCYQKMEKIEVVLCELDQQKREEISRLYRIDSTGDYQQVLAADFDIIDICLPTYLHQEYAIKAARAGKHVFCEKPMALNEEAAWKMLSVCRENGVKLGIGMVLRFYPEYRALRQRYQEGLVGEAGVINGFRGGGGYPRGWNDWYADEQASSSLVVDLLIHEVDFIQWIFGDVRRVYAKRKCSAGRSGEDKFEIYSTIFQLENGVLVNLDGSWYDEGGFHSWLEVAGTDGLIAIRPERSIPIKTQFNSPLGAEVAVPASPLTKTPFQLELEDFVEAVQQDRPPGVRVEEAIKALRVTLKMYQSAQLGEVIDVKGGQSR